MILDKKVKTIITIPAYNEENTIASIIDEIHEVMKKTKYDYKIEVVDDGSKDKTAELAKKHKAEVISHKRNQGLAKAFQPEIKTSI